MDTLECEVVMTDLVFWDSCCILGIGPIAVCPSPPDPTQQHQSQALFYMNEEQVSLELTSNGDVEQDIDNIENARRAGFIEIEVKHYVFEDDILVEIIAARGPSHKNGKSVRRENSYELEALRDMKSQLAFLFVGNGLEGKYSKDHSLASPADYEINIDDRLYPESKSNSPSNGILSTTIDSLSDDVFETESQTEARKEMLMFALHRTKAKSNLVEDVLDNANASIMKSTEECFTEQEINSNRGSDYIKGMKLNCEEKEIGGEQGLEDVEGLENNQGKSNIALETYDLESSEMKISSLDSFDTNLTSSSLSGSYSLYSLFDSETEVDRKEEIVILSRKDSFKHKSRNTEQEGLNISTAFAKESQENGHGFGETEKCSNTKLKGNTDDGDLVPDSEIQTKFEKDGMTVARENEEKNEDRNEFEAEYKKEGDMENYNDNTELCRDEIADSKVINKVEELNENDVRQYEQEKTGVVVSDFNPNLDIEAKTSAYENGNALTVLDGKTGCLKQSDTVSDGEYDSDSAISENLSVSVDLEIFVRVDLGTSSVTGYSSSPSPSNSDIEGAMSECQACNEYNFSAYTRLYKENGSRRWKDSENVQEGSAEKIAKEIVDKVLVASQNMVAETADKTINERNKQMVEMCDFDETEFYLRNEFPHNDLNKSHKKTIYYGQKEIGGVEHAASCEIMHFQPEQNEHLETVESAPSESKPIYSSDMFQSTPHGNQVLKPKEAGSDPVPDLCSATFQGQVCKSKQQDSVENVSESQLEVRNETTQNAKEGTKKQDSVNTASDSKPELQSSTIQDLAENCLEAESANIIEECQTEHNNGVTQNEERESQEIDSVETDSERQLEPNDSITQDQEKSLKVEQAQAVNESLHEQRRDIKEDEAHENIEKVLADALSENHTEPSGDITPDQGLGSQEVEFTDALFESPHSGNITYNEDEEKQGDESADAVNAIQPDQIQQLSQEEVYLKQEKEWANALNASQTKPTAVSVDLEICVRVDLETVSATGNSFSTSPTSDGNEAAMSEFPASNEYNFSEYTKMCKEKNRNQRVRDIENVQEGSAEKMAKEIVGKVLVASQIMMVETADRALNERSKQMEELFDNDETNFDLRNELPLNDVNETHQKTTYYGQKEIGEVEHTVSCEIMQSLPEQNEYLEIVEYAPCESKRNCISDISQNTPKGSQEIKSNETGSDTSPDLCSDMNPLGKNKQQDSVENLSESQLKLNSEIVQNEKEESKQEESVETAGDSSLELQNGIIQYQVKYCLEVGSADTVGESQSQHSNGIIQNEEKELQEMDSIDAGSERQPEPNNINTQDQEEKSLKVESAEALSETHQEESGDITDDQVHGSLEKEKDIQEIKSVDAIYECQSKADDDRTQNLEKEIQEKELCNTVCESQLDPSDYITSDLVLESQEDVESADATSVSQAKASDNRKQNLEKEIQEKELSDTIYEGQSEPSDYITQDLAFESLEEVEQADATCESQTEPCGDKTQVEDKEMQEIESTDTVGESQPEPSDDITHDQVLERQEANPAEAICESHPEPSGDRTQIQDKEMQEIESTDTIGEHQPVPSDEITPDQVLERQEVGSADAVCESRLEQSNYITSDQVLERHELESIDAIYVNQQEPSSDITQNQDEIQEVESADGICENQGEPSDDSTENQEEDLQTNELTDTVCEGEPELNKNITYNQEGESLEVELADVVCGLQLAGIGPILQDQVSESQEKEVVDTYSQNETKLSNDITHYHVQENQEVESADDVYKNQQKPSDDRILDKEEESHIEVSDAVNESQAKASGDRTQYQVHESQKKVVDALIENKPGVSDSITHDQEDECKKVKSIDVSEDQPGASGSISLDEEDGGQEVDSANVTHESQPEPSVDRTCSQEEESQKVDSADDLFKSRSELNDGRPCNQAEENLEVESAEAICGNQLEPSDIITPDLELEKKLGESADAVCESQPGSSDDKTYNHEEGWQEAESADLCEIQSDLFGNISQDQVLVYKSQEKEWTDALTKPSDEIANYHVQESQEVESADESQQEPCGDKTQNHDEENEEVESADAMCESKVNPRDDITHDQEEESQELELPNATCECQPELSGIIIRDQEGERLNVESAYTVTESQTETFGCITLEQIEGRQEVESANTEIQPKQSCITHDQKESGQEIEPADTFTESQPESSGYISFDQMEGSHEIELANNVTENQSEPRGDINHDQDEESNQVESTNIVSEDQMVSSSCINMDQKEENNGVENADIRGNLSEISDVRSGKTVIEIQPETNCDITQVEERQEIETVVSQPGPSSCKMHSQLEEIQEMHSSNYVNGNQQISRGITSLDKAQESHEKESGDNVTENYPDPSRGITQDQVEAEKLVSCYNVDTCQLDPNSGMLNDKGEEEQEVEMADIFSESQQEPSGTQTHGQVKDSQDRDQAVTVNEGQSEISSDVTQDQAVEGNLDIERADTVNESQSEPDVGITQDQVKEHQDIEIADTVNQSHMESRVSITHDQIEESQGVGIADNVNENKINTSISIAQDQVGESRSLESEDTPSEIQPKRDSDLTLNKVEERQEVEKADTVSESYPDLSVAKILSQEEGSQLESGDLNPSCGITQNLVEKHQGIGSEESVTECQPNPSSGLTKDHKKESQEVETFDMVRKRQSEPSGNIFMTSVKDNQEVKTDDVVRECQYKPSSGITGEEEKEGNGIETANEFDGSITLYQVEESQDIDSFLDISERKPEVDGGKTQIHIEKIQGEEVASAISEHLPEPSCSIIQGQVEEIQKVEIADASCGSQLEPGESILKDQKEESQEVRSAVGCREGHQESSGSIALGQDSQEIDSADTNIENQSEPCDIEPSGGITHDQVQESQELDSAESVIEIQPTHTDGITKDHKERSQEVDLTDTVNESQPEPSVCKTGDQIDENKKVISPDAFSELDVLSCRTTGKIDENEEVESADTESKSEPRGDIIHDWVEISPEVKIAATISESEQNGCISQNQVSENHKVESIDTFSLSKTEQEPCVGIIQMQLEARLQDSVRENKSKSNFSIIEYQPEVIQDQESLETVSKSQTELTSSIMHSQSDKNKDQETDIVNKNKVEIGNVKLQSGESPDLKTEDAFNKNKPELNSDRKQSQQDKRHPASPSDDGIECKQDVRVSEDCEENQRNRIRQDILAATDQMEVNNTAIAKVMEVFDGIIAKDSLKIDGSDQPQIEYYEEELEPANEEKPLSATGKEEFEAIDDTLHLQRDVTGNVEKNKRQRKHDRDLQQAGKDKMSTGSRKRQKKESNNPEKRSQNLKCSSDASDSSSDEIDDSGQYHPELYEQMIVPTSEKSEDIKADDYNKVNPAASPVASDETKQHSVKQSVNLTCNASHQSDNIREYQPEAETNIPQRQNLIVNNHKHTSASHQNATREKRHKELNEARDGDGDSDSIDDSGQYHPELYIKMIEPNEPDKTRREEIPAFHQEEQVRRRGIDLSHYGEISGLSAVEIDLEEETDGIVDPNVVKEKLEKWLKAERDTSIRKETERFIKGGLPEEQSEIKQRVQAKCNEQRRQHSRDSVDMESRSSREKVYSRSRHSSQEGIYQLSRHNSQEGIYRSNRGSPEELYARSRQNSLEALYGRGIGFGDGSSPRGQYNRSRQSSQDNIYARRSSSSQGKEYESSRVRSRQNSKEGIYERRYSNQSESSVRSRHNSGEDMYRSWDSNVRHGSHESNKSQINKRKDNYERSEQNSQEEMFQGSFDQKYQRDSVFEGQSQNSHNLHDDLKAQRRDVIEKRTHSRHDDLYERKNVDRKDSLELVHERNERNLSSPVFEEGFMEGRLGRKSDYIEVKKFRRDNKNTLGSDKRKADFLTSAQLKIFCQPKKSPKPTSGPVDMLSVSIERPRSKENERKSLEKNSSFEKMKDIQEYSLDSLSTQPKKFDVYRYEKHHKTSRRSHSKSDRDGRIDNQFSGYSGQLNESGISHKDEKYRQIYNRNVDTADIGRLESYNTIDQYGKNRCAKKRDASLPTKVVTANTNQDNGEAFYSSNSDYVHTRSKYQQNLGGQRYPKSIDGVRDKGRMKIPTSSGETSKDGPLSLTDTFAPMDRGQNENHNLSQSAGRLSDSTSSLNNRMAPAKSPSRQNTLQKQTSVQSNQSEINGEKRDDPHGIKFERLKNLEEDELMAKIKEIIGHLEKLEDYHRGDGMRIQKMLGDMYWDYTHLREMIADCMAENGYAVVSMKMLKTLNSIGIFKNDDVWFPTYYTYNTMWNFSDASSNLARTLSENDAVRLLTLNCGHKPYINALHSKNVFYVIKASLSILHNMARNSGMKHLFDENKTSETIMPFMDSEDEMLKILATLTIANIVDEEENKTVIAETGTIHCMVSWIEKAISLPRRRFKGFTPQELTEGLNKLAVNDSNKMRIVEESALPLFLLMLQHDDVREQSSAGRIIWTLSFDKDVRQKLLENSDLIATLEKLTESTNKSVQQNANGALWIIKGENDISRESKPKGTPTKSHVFLSYSWSDKDTVLQIRDKLRAEGYAIWIDIEKGSSASLEGMANAVENSAVVLICMSEKYKQNPNCRTESEYTFQLKKDYIPLMLQKKYRPDGWLGFILGAKLYFDFSGKYPFDKSLTGLLKELRGRGQVTPNTTPVGSNETSDGAMVTSQSLTSYASPGTPVPSNSVLMSMGQEELVKWLRVVKLTECIPAFLEFDGKLLMQLKQMRTEAPEFFYQCLEKRLNMSLIEILKFTRALEELH